MAVVERSDCTSYFCHLLRNWIQSKNSGVIFNIRDLHVKQITTATYTTVVMDTESRGEYVTIARQIATLSKRRRNSDYGVSSSIAFAFTKSY